MAVPPRTSYRTTCCSPAASAGSPTVRSLVMGLHFTQDRCPGRFDCSLVAAYLSRASARPVSACGSALLGPADQGLSLGQPGLHLAHQGRGRAYRLSPQIVTSRLLLILYVK